MTSSLEALAARIRELTPAGQCDLAAALLRANEPETARAVLRLTLTTLDEALFQQDLDRTDRELAAMRRRAEERHG